MCPCGDNSRITPTSSYVCSMTPADSCVVPALVHVGCDNCVTSTYHRSTSYVCKTHPSCRVLFTGPLVWQLHSASVSPLIPWIPGVHNTFRKWDNFRQQALLRTDLCIPVTPSEWKRYTTTLEQEKNGLSVKSPLRLPSSHRTVEGVFGRFTTHRSHHRHEDIVRSETVVPQNTVVTIHSGVPQVMYVVDSSPDVYFAARVEIYFTSTRSSFEIVPIIWLPSAPVVHKLEFTLQPGGAIYSWIINPTKWSGGVLSVPASQCPQPPPGAWCFDLDWCLCRQ